MTDIEARYDALLRRIEAEGVQNPTRGRVWIAPSDPYAKVMREKWELEKLGATRNITSTEWDAKSVEIERRLDAEKERLRSLPTIGERVTLSGATYPTYYTIVGQKRFRTGVAPVWLVKRTGMSVPSDEAMNVREYSNIEWGELESKGSKDNIPVRSPMLIVAEKRVEDKVDVPSTVRVTRESVQERLDQ
jgi:hypothetical protein